MDRFNAGLYYERFLDDDDESVHLGEIEEVGDAPKPHKREIRSQMVTYLDKWDRTIVIAHQYGRKDGTAAKGTRPDPKFIYEGGVRYKYDASLDAYVS